MPVVSRPRLKVGIDHFEPCGKYPDVHGYSAILEVKDLHSKMVTLFPCVGKSHLEVQKYLAIYFQMYPGVKEVVADNYFTGVALDKFFERSNIKKILTPAYRPCANGPTERINRELRKLIPQLLEDLAVPWNRWSDPVF